jgi:CopG family nickel-responsive transcriptional regulator
MSKKIEILSFSIPPSLVKETDSILKKMGYSSRSEIIRDALRSFIHEKKELDEMEGFLEGTVNIYHEQSADRLLSEVRHRNSKLVKSYMHAHFQHTDKCLDILVVSGKVDEIRNLLYELESIKGVELVRTLSIPMEK